MIVYVLFAKRILMIYSDMQVSKAVADAMSLCETELRGLNAELAQALEPLGL